MTRKYWLGLINLILCLSLIGMPSTGKVNAQPAAPDQAPTGFTYTSLQSQAGSANTGEKPQSKVWYYEGKWWSVFPASSGVTSSGTWLWRLDGTTWTPVLKLSTSITAKADVKPAGTPAGSVVHILLYAEFSSADLASVQYNSGTSTYEAWSSRPGLSHITLSGSEIATIDIDSTGRMWLATENDTDDQIVVYYSGTPYSTWSGPVSLASGVNDDDISVVTTLRNNTVGVLWSNQNTKRFGFRYHKDTDPATTWSTEELPTSQYGYNVGVSGFADDHLNVAVASDGTLYAAVKTSYDTAGYPKIAMLVRRLSGDPGAGVWDANIYGVSESGTRGIVVLDDTAGVVTVIYTSSESGGSILYRQTATQPIAFSAVQTMRSGGPTLYNNVSSTKQNINGELVVIYSAGTTVNGSLCTAIPTAVNLVDFIATSIPHAFQLTWQTAQETDLLGFNLFRAEELDGPHVKINPQLIPAINPGQLRGNDYQYLDATAEVGKIYNYWVEWVGNTNSELYGPETASLVPYTFWLPLGMK